MTVCHSSLNMYDKLSKRKWYAPRQEDNKK